MSTGTRWFAGRAGRMVRFVVGGWREPEVEFLDGNAPRFGAAPELRAAWDGDAFTLTDEGPEGARGTVLRGRAGHAPLRLDVEVGDAQVFGFGAANGAETRDGADFRLSNRDTIMFSVEGASYSSFPFFMARSTAGTFGVLVLTSFPLDVSVRGGKVAMRAARDTGGALLDVVVLRGSAAEIVEDLASLVGRACLPPAWALGFHQSRWSYRSDEEVLGVARRFRQEDLPADVVHLDIDYMDRYRVFTWDPQRFPRPSTMHDELRALGFRTLAIVDPGVSVAEGYAVHEKVRSLALLTTSKGRPYVGHVWPGRTVFPDFSDEATRAAWGGFHAPLLDAGVGGIWNDMNDPAFRMGRAGDPLDEDVRHVNGSHARLRNLYANHMARATWEGVKRLRPGKRPFILTRSGFLGIQRHAAMWTGDNFGSWEQLRENLHMVVNLGLCGVPMTGADVGGFGGKRGLLGGFKWRPPAELFVRWMELGALMPFFRVHCVLYAPRQEPWSFGEEALRHARAILRRRYALLPLLYRLALEAHETGLPIVRPAWMHFDVPRGAMRDQFLVGDSLLAAPVTEAGATRREAWLPAGAWIDVHTGERREGNRHVVVDAPLGRCPLFRRAGVPLFTAAPQRNAEETLRSTLFLDVEMPAAGARERGTLFLDDGESDAGARFLLDAVAEEREGALRVSFERRAESFTPVQRAMVVRVPQDFTGVLVDGERRELAQGAPAEDGGEARREVAVPLGTREVRFTK